MTVLEPLVYEAAGALPPRSGDVVFNSSDMDAEREKLDLVKDLERGSWSCEVLQNRKVKVKFTT